MAMISIPNKLRPWRLRTLVVICLCVPSVFGQPAPAPTRASANDLLFTDLPGTNSARQTWRDRTSAAKSTPKDTQSKIKLQNTLNRLKSLRFAEPDRPKTQVTAPDANQPVAEPTAQPPKTKPGIIINPPKPINVPESPNSVPASSSTLTLKTTEALALLAKSPEKIVDPEALAQILFQSKAYPEAALYYEEALQRLNKKNTAPTEDKAWLLFQIGNSLQHSDPEMTMRKYKQLISEYPLSLWAELVRIKGQCITWELREKPKALISEIKARAIVNRKK